VAIDGQHSDPKALTLEPLERVEHGVVLGGLGDEVVAPVVFHRGHALEGEVVGLGGPAGEDDLTRVGPDQGSHPGSGLLHGLVGLSARAMVSAGRVGEVLGEVRQHGIEHPPVGGRGGVVVEIDAGLPHRTSAGYLPLYFSLILPPDQCDCLIGKGVACVGAVGRE
jgi:hypothetical protein